VELKVLIISYIRGKNNPTTPTKKRASCIAGGFSFYAKPEIHDTRAFCPVLYCIRDKTVHFFKYRLQAPGTKFQIPIDIQWVSTMKYCISRICDIGACMDFEQSEASSPKVNLVTLSCLPWAWRREVEVQKPETRNVTIYPARGIIQSIFAIFTKQTIEDLYQSVIIVEICGKKAFWWAE
jgi:hypothetical protein